MTARGSQLAITDEQQADYAGDSPIEMSLILSLLVVSELILPLARACVRYRTRVRYLPPLFPMTCRWTEDANFSSCSGLGAAEKTEEGGYHAQYHSIGAGRNRRKSNRR